EEIDLEKIMTHLQMSLPYYMIPNVIIPLEEFPLTPNQKIDRKALPSVSSEDIFRKKYVAPQSEIEKGLALIWEDVLGIKNIGVTDDFFELGGHSLLLGQVINRIQKLLGGSVGYKDFFTNPTIFGLSKVIEISTYVTIPNVEESESYPLTPSQNRLWVLSQLQGGELAYNMPAAVILKGIIDINKFQEAFLKLIARHEILRTSFRANHEGEISQFIVPVQQVEFKISKQDFLLSMIKKSQLKII
ncbi:condensation domain-containing protein, partial [Chryseobacterium proteolyticum]|uniref:condensation domain-containing protein n=1 Tax=Chryseobacterium proteolyticum TaxID=118127 RepID=UPI0039832AE7